MWWAHICPVIDIFRLEGHGERNVEIRHTVLLKKINLTDFIQGDNESLVVCCRLCVRKCVQAHIRKYREETL